MRFTKRNILMGLVLVTGFIAYLNYRNSTRVSKFRYLQPPINHNSLQLNIDTNQFAYNDGGDKLEYFNNEGKDSIDNFQDFLKSMQESEEHRIVITSLPQSGASYLSKFFQMNKNVHYVHEPFKLLPVSQRQDLTQYLNNILNCEYSKYFSAVFNESQIISDNQLKHVKEIFGRHYMKSNSSAIELPEVTQKECVEYKVHAVSTMLLQLVSSLQSLMLGQGVSVLLLIRDPRAVAFSLAQLKAKYDHKSKSTEIKHIVYDDGAFLKMAEQVCDEQYSMMLDIKKLLQYASHLRGKLAVIRYEDLIFGGHEMTTTVHKFIEVEMPSRIKDSAINETQLMYNRYVTQKWRQSVPYRVVENIQNTRICSTVLDFYGYGTVRSEHHLHALVDDTLERKPSSALRFLLKN